MSQMTPDALTENSIAPLISVIFPVYNGEKFLCEAVDSILAQTFSDFELIIIDDGSIDGSLQILREYELRDSRIRIVTRENRGLPATLNDALEIARGKFLARMDQDDISHPERFAKQVALMQAEEADICGCHWLVINEAGKYIDARLMPLCNDTITICLAETVPFAHGSVMMRRSFLLQHSLKYETRRYSEDYDLWIRIYECRAKFANVNDFLFLYRESSSSLSKRKRKEMAEDTRMLKSGFVKRNANACLKAVQNLSKDFSHLSLTERINLLITSYRVSLVIKRPIIFDIIKRSTRRAVFMALIEIVK